MHKQIGNAIPPRLAYELGKQIKKHLNGMRQSLEVSTYIPGTGTVGTSKKTYTY
jgi:hypothetical protein